MSIIRRHAAARNFVGGLAVFFLTASPLQAGELTAMEAQSIDVGRFHGVLYYTEEGRGYQVVATIADGEDGLPIRFSTTLAEDQSAFISVPGKSGESGSILEIVHSGDTLTLSEKEPASDM
jgi:hypothetical protein